jgi:hypothetical protein
MLAMIEAADFRSIQRESSELNNAETMFPPNSAASDSGFEYGLMQCGIKSTQIEEVFRCVARRGVEKMAPNSLINVGWLHNHK